MNSKSELNETPLGSAWPGSAPRLSGDAATPRVSPKVEADLPSLARLAVETFVTEHRIIEPPSVAVSSSLGQSSACFVCIKTADRKLRGCVGTVEPEQSSLAAEVVYNAIKAATRDPRFRPVSAPELRQLRYSVDILDCLEPTRIEDLNPVVFGVVVVDGSGTRRGLLLPDIEGIGTAEEQIGVASRKAGIESHEPLKLYRFRTRRFIETA
jgi:AmmeMemoRadiSam system protein A